MLGSGINLIWCHFYSCLLSNWLFAEKFSNCSNSLNFEAKINCNTIKPNVPKWRKTCTGLKFDLLHFYGPQSHILSGGNLWGPCSMSIGSIRRKTAKIEFKNDFPCVATVFKNFAYLPLKALLCWVAGPVPQPGGGGLLAGGLAAGAHHRHQHHRALPPLLVSVNILPEQKASCG